MFSTKTIVWAVLIAILILVGTWVYVKDAGPRPMAPITNTQTAQKASSLPVTAYSVNGTILQVSAKQIILAVQVAAPAAGGSVTATQQTKVVVINSATTFGFMTSSSHASAADLKVGEQIAVNTNVDPLKSTSFTAEQITINK